MAVAYAPVDADLVTFDEAVALLRDTPYTPSRATLKRWGLPRARIAGTDYVSYSDVLEMHRDKIRQQGVGG